MATIDSFTRRRSFAGEASLSFKPSRIKQALIGIGQGWRAYVRYRRLSNMSDEALHQRGLTRHQIGRHAFFGDDDQAV